MWEEQTFLIREVIIEISPEAETSSPEVENGIYLEDGNN